MKSLLAAMFILTAALPLSGQTSAAPAQMPAEWTKEPVSYKDTPFGTTWEAFAAKNNLEYRNMWAIEYRVKDGKRTPDVLHCGTRKKGVVPAFCEAQMPLFADGTGVREIWEFDDGKLSGVSWFFHPDRYAKVREILVARYGEPQSVTSDKVGNRAGFETTQETVMWAGKKFRVIAAQYTSDFDHASVSFIDAVAQDARIAKEKANVEKAKTAF